MAAESPRLSRHHQRRLRTYYRSAGWPCHDAIEIDLLAAGLIVREAHAGGADTIRVTESGIAAIATALNGNRRARDAHEALALQVAEKLCSEGRLVFRGLRLRAHCERSEERRVGKCGATRRGGSVRRKGNVGK